MDPWDRRREFWKRLFGSDFGMDMGFDEEFRRMEKEIAKMLQDAMENAPSESDEEGPFVYGFSMRVGPDGEPQIQEFGNTKGRKRLGGRESEEGREPLTDVIKEDEDITVIAEVPGVEKEDIDLSTKPDELTIKVDDAKRKYFKRIDLPAEVDTESAKATYKNGVLEVKLKRREKEKSRGTKIEIN